MSDLAKILLSILFGLGCGFIYYLIRSMFKPEDRRAEWMQKMADLDKMLSLTPTEFEKLVKLVFERMGYKVRETTHSADAGIDLWLGKEGEKAIVQCKRWKNQVGTKVVREFFGALIDSKADKGYIVTTSKFSLPAQNLVANKPIQLVDGMELVELIQSYAQDEFES